MQARTCVMVVVCVVFAGLLVGCDDSEKKSKRDRDDDVVQVSMDDSSGGGGKSPMKRCGIADRECREMQAMAEMDAAMEMMGDAGSGEMGDAGSGEMGDAGSGEMGDAGSGEVGGTSKPYSPSDPPGLGEGVCGELLTFIREDLGAVEYGAGELFDGEYCVREDRMLAECFLQYPEVLRAEFEGAEDHPDWDDLGECLNGGYESFNCDRYDLMVLSCAGYEYEAFPEEELGRPPSECTETRIDMGECAMWHKEEFCWVLEQGRDITDYVEGENRFVDCVLF